jgi:hypothetical protein
MMVIDTEFEVREQVVGMELPLIADPDGNRIGIDDLCQFFIIASPLLTSFQIPR